MPVYNFGPFRLDTANRKLSRRGEALPLQPKAYDVLLMLVENRNRVVPRTELLDSVWGVDVNVEEGSLNYQIRQLRKTLGDAAFKPKYIKTIPRVGFQFVAALTEPHEEAPTVELSRLAQPGEEIGLGANDSAWRQIPPQPQPEGASQPISERLSFPLAGHLGHVVLVCALYASLYGIELVVEVSYDIDHYPKALPLATVLFLWIFATSLAGLTLDWKLTLKGSRAGLAVSSSAFLAATIVLLGAVRSFLPAVPITESTLQAFTAQVAYLKTVAYFVTLGAFFILIPFHFVAAMQRELQGGRDRFALELLTGSKLALAPRGTFYLRFGTLAVILGIMFLFGLVSTYYLFDHLKTSAHMNLFELLVYGRFILYFALGLKSLAWYYRALYDLKRECLTVWRESLGTD